jgi:hypothetical protein
VLDAAEQSARESFESGAIRAALTKINNATRVRIN